jgi:hypothetical protein
VSDGTTRLSRRWDVIIVGSAVALALVVLVVAVVVRNGRSDASGPGGSILPPVESSAPSDTTTTPPSAPGTAPTNALDPASTVIGVLGGRFTSPEGVVVDVPAGALADDTVLTVAPGTLPAPTGEALSGAGPLVDIEVDAPLLAPISITFPVTDSTALQPVALPDGTTVEAPAPFVAHYRDGAWEPIPGTSSPDRSTITITTDDLSPFWLVSIGRWIGSFVRSMAESFTGGLYTDIPEPDCGGGTDESSLWSLQPADGPVSWCGARRDTGERVVQVANRKRYGISVSAPTGATIESDSANDLAGQLAQWAALPGQVALSPGSTATVTFPDGVSPLRVRSEYDGLAQTLSTLTISAEILAAIAAKMPFSGTRSSKQFLDTLDGLMCLTSAGVDVVAVAQNSASSLAKLVRGCLDTMLELLPKGLGVVLSGTVGIVLSTVAYFFSSGQALFDLVTNSASATLTYTGATPPPPVGVVPVVASGWPTSDLEGPPALYAWFGTEFWFPSWVSCSTSFCIAGSSDTVRVYRIKPSLGFLGTMEVGDADPAATLVNAGFPSDEVATMLTPGAPPG